MQLAKSKELLQQDLDDPGSVDILDLNYAQQQAIWAIERLQACRKHGVELSLQALPGESYSPP